MSSSESIYLCLFLLSYYTSSKYHEHDTMIYAPGFSKFAEYINFSLNL